jgi:hypothetical protein
VGSGEGEVPTVIKRSAVVALAFVAIAVACDDTPNECTSCRCDPCPPHEQQQFQDLSKRWHVLNNFELAHNKRNMSEYEKLIDDNYTFSFDTIKNDSLTTIQWGRADEITATAGLLAAANSMDMAIDWEDSRGNPTVQWSEEIVGTETWYYTTVFYHFTIRIDQATYIPVAGAQMTFTVRMNGTTDKPIWKLVELRDNAHINAPPPPAPAVSLHTEETTYGKVKSGF